MGMMPMGDKPYKIYSKTISGLSINTAWGSFYYKSYDFKVDGVNLNGKTILPFYNCDPTSSVSLLITSGELKTTSTTNDTVVLNLMRPTQGTANGTLYLIVFDE